jgi:O-antigen ligase
VEVRAAWPNIEKHPWLGIGVGGTYRYVEDWSDPTQEHFLRPVSYIHDAYVLLLTHTGILGLGTCLAMYVTFFVRARKIYYRQKRPEDKALALSAIGAIASVMLASIMQPSLWYPPAVPLIGMIFGMIELLRYFADSEARQSEQAEGWSPLARPRSGQTSLAGAVIRTSGRVPRARSGAGTAWRSAGAPRSALPPPPPRASA